MDAVVDYAVEDGAVVAVDVVDNAVAAAGAGCCCGRGPGPGP